MTATRPALRLLQALLGLMLLVGAWQGLGVKAATAGVAAAGWSQDDGRFAALTDAGGGWTVGLADDTAPDLFDDGTDPDESGTILRAATLEPPCSAALLVRANLAQAPPRPLWRSALSTGPPAA